MKKFISLMLVLLLTMSMLCAPALAKGQKTTIVLSHTGTVTLGVGQTLQLGATVNPAAAVEWSTSKEKVASVDAKGKVTAASEGTATITAKAGGKKVKVKIKVVDPYKPDSIAIAQGKAATVSIGSTLQLKATLNPATAKSALTWTSNKTKIATVDANGKVTPVAEGKAKITVKTANKKKAVITVTVVDPYKPASLAINQGKTATMTVGNALKLTTTLTPATAKSTLIWKSSKPKVAIVDANGNVTAVG